jgi:putative enoyl-(acyl-carrier-protein) reductase II
MIKTKICDLLGIEYPIFQGGMAWVANASLASAVSNAGGLGIIAGMNSNAEQLTAEVNKLRAMTDKPFGVNVMLMSPFVDEVAQAVIDLKVPVVTTGAGNASKYMKQWIEAGIKVIPVVPSTALAKMAERSGATAVIAEGCESGGHIGELTTMTLVPQVCDVVSIPVIAAGGIADGRGVAASFMLGACAVQLGTRFLVATECTISQAYKDKVLAAKDIDTIVTGKRLSHPVRGLKNNLTKQFWNMEYDSNITNEEIEQFAAGALRRAVEGDVKNGSVIAGQIAGMVKKEQSCREIIVEIFEETETILRGASKWA